MAKIFYLWIKAERLNIEDVPERWQEQVKIMINENNG